MTHPLSQTGIVMIKRPAAIEMWTHLLDLNVKKTHALYVSTIHYEVYSGNCFCAACRDGFHMSREDGMLLILPQVDARPS